MSYDTNNIFARIIRGEVPCNKVYEDDFVLAFHDISPQAPVHVLVIPKGAYRHYADFSRFASADEIIAFTHAVGYIAAELGLEPQGFRLVTNNGTHAGQEVPHFHAHILGGGLLPSLINKELTGR